MSTIQDIRADDSSWESSLVKLTGAQIKDVIGFIDREFGDPVFHVTEIQFTDGTRVDVAGEHDIAYLSLYPHSQPANLDTDTLRRLYEEQRAEDD